MNLQIRACRAEDIHLLFNWANDPETRENAFTQELIKWEDHVKWFNSRISSDRCRIYILEFNNVPAGQIRFDKNEQEELVISYSVDEKLRGKGLGRKIVELGLKEITGWGNNIKALVKKNNPASIRVFETLGFLKTENKDFIEFKIQMR